MKGNLEIKDFLDGELMHYLSPEFIETDPVQIPHFFTKKEDIEIAGFLTATIAWGQRKSIINNAKKMMDLLENAPFECIMDKNFISQTETKLKKFVHRTFNGEDFLFFLQSLQNIYLHCGGLEQVFTKGFKETNSIYGALHNFRKIFLQSNNITRSKKHISDVSTNSSAKRLNMFLRWMVRNDKEGVDFGLWKNIPASLLMLPLDVHTGNVSRNLGLLNRKQNDWKAVEEITNILRTFDPEDPIKYDFVLFGLGAFKNSGEQFIRC